MCRGLVLAFYYALNVKLLAGWKAVLHCMATATLVSTAERLLDEAHVRSSLCLFLLNSYRSPKN